MIVESTVSLFSFRIYIANTEPNSEMGMILEEGYGFEKT